jgi:hypothetical protein
VQCCPLQHHAPLYQSANLTIVRTFIGSWVAIVVGVFTILGGLQEPISPDGIDGGITMIFGALTCRFAKQRRLGLRPDTPSTRTAEILGLIGVLCPVPALAYRGFEAWASNPVSGIVVPLWTLIAYGLAIRRVDGSDKAPTLL